MTNRKGNSFKEDFRIALELRPQKLPTRSGKHGDYMKIFANNKQLDHLKTKNWQVVFGRRGTGKTTLLGAFSEYIESEFRENRACCMRINMLECMSDIKIGTKDPSCTSIDDHTQARAHFASLIENIGKKLFEIYATENNESLIFKRSIFSPKKNAIYDKVLEIVGKCTIGIPAFEASQVSGQSSFLSFARHKNSFASSIGLGLGLGLSGGGRANGEATVGCAGESGDESTMKQEVGVIYKIDFGEIKSDIEDLLQLLDIETMYVLIDEWSEIDRVANSNVQPIFAEYLKRTFGGNGKFSIKIAAIRPQTKFICTYNGKTWGIEQGADIFPIDLDHVFGSGEINLVTFYEELLFRHLSYCNSRLEIFASDAQSSPRPALNAKPNREFITYVFKNRKIFSDVIKGAGRIPRDFIEIIDHIARERDYSVEPLWGYGDIAGSIHNHYIKNKEINIIKNVDEENSYKILVSKTKKNKNRLFLVKKNDDEQKRRIIAEFYLQRIIHEVSPDQIPAEIRVSYDAYYADFGILLDVSKKGNSFDDIVEECPLSSGCSEDEISEYII